MCICVCVRVWIYKCAYYIYDTYICICIHIYIHIYTHIHIPECIHDTPRWWHTSIHNYFHTHWHIHTCVCTGGQYEHNARLHSLSHTLVHSQTHTHTLSHICSRRDTQCTFDLLAPIPCIYMPLQPLVKIVSTLSKASNVGHCNDVVSCYQVRIVSGFRTR